MKSIFKPCLFFVCFLLLTGCGGTLAYKLDESVIKSMSFQEAKDKVESLFAQTCVGGHLEVHMDRIEITSPFRQNCYFNAMPPIDIKDYGPLAGAGGYPLGSRYVVGLGSDQHCKYIMFRSYEAATAFASAAYVLKNTPLQAKESFFQAHKQRENMMTNVQPPIKPDTVAIPQVISDIDELPAIKAKPNKNAYAIVIGIESYRQKLPKADFAIADARTMTEYLTKVMGYPEENIVTLTNEHASKSDFEKYFEKWLGNNVEKGDTVFIYYSGHGAPNPKTGDAYLVPYDGDPSFIAETGYSLKRMYDALGKLQAKEIIVALDSCFSGAGGRSVIAKGARPLVMNLQSNMALSRNMTVLSASSGEQISSTYDEKGHGLFTYFLLKGIKNEDVIKQDGSIKMDDLFGYIKPQVERIARKQYNNEQTPQLIGAKKN
jgi:Uncharacterized protein containing caspase domain